MVIPIIIPCYNRPQSLTRLLNSLSQGVYNVNVPLYISIEGDPSEDVIKIANEFIWAFGKKTIIRRETKLGLKAHIIACGDIILLDELDGAIILEDDIYVSPYFYDYVLQSVSFFSTDNTIAGISLYSPSFNQVNALSFIPLHNGYDNYFMQLVCSWGQVWLKSHWQAFKEWMSEDSLINWEIHLPSYIANWPTSTSWDKEYIKFMIEKDLYFVYPYQSLSTNFADAGTHIPEKCSKFQVKLLGISKNWVFKEISNANYIYDSFGELLPSCIKNFNANLKKYDFDTNLNCTKNKINLKKDYVLMPLLDNDKVTAECLFAKELVPVENNILFGLAGSELAIIEKSKLLPFNFKPSANDLSFAFGIPITYINKFYIKGQNYIINGLPFYIGRIMRKLKFIKMKTLY